MGPEKRKENSVYDFLYVDFPRIQIFNSQFNQYGHITDLTRSTKTSTSQGGGIDLKLVKADASEGEESEISKRYDAQFIAPLNFLDNAQDIIIRDLSSARTGQLILVSGNLRILDLGMLQKAWEKPAIRRFVESGGQTSSADSGKSRQQRRRENKISSSEENEQVGTNFLFELLQIMPHGIQCQIEANRTGVWCALNSNGFITQPADLTLNHGNKIAGRWNVVGILDAAPDQMVETLSEGENSIQTPEYSLVGNLAATTQPVVKAVLGRPSSYYGATPLLIFREVAA